MNPGFWKHSLLGLIIGLAICFTALAIHGAEPIEAHRIGSVRIRKDNQFYPERFTFKGWRQETLSGKDDAPYYRPAYLLRDNSGNYWRHSVEVFAGP